MSLTIHALVLAAGLSAAVSVPQTPETPSKRPAPPAQTDTKTQTKPTHLPLAELMDADVLLEPSGAEKREAAGEGERPDRPKGEIKDLILSTRDGQIAYSVLSVGGILGIGDKVVLIPSSSLKWTPGEKKHLYSLRMTEAELKALPAFDADKANKEGLDRALERTKGTPAEAGARKDDASKASAPNFILASELKGCDVNASDKEFGKVREATVDTARNSVDYILVNEGGVLGAGGTVRIVPYRNCIWTRFDDKNILKLAKTSDQLKSAPEYKKSSEGFLTPDQMRSAEDFFGSKRPSDSGATNPH